MSAYQQLVRQFKKISDLEHVQSITSWDAAAMMPTGGGRARGDALATLGVTIHELKTDERMFDWLELAAEEDLSGQENANVREMSRQHREATCLNSDLVGHLTRSTAECEQAWQIYRAENNWQDMQPLLDKVLGFIREEAAMRADSTGLSLYNAMLDVYEPDMTCEKLDKLFSGLKSFLPGLVDEVIELQKQNPVVSVGDSFPVAKQKELGMSIMSTLGFDFDHGRLDISHHPFCGGVPEDVRITTRYSDDNFVQSLMGVIHETGHAMYEQGLPKDWITQPVGAALSAGTHESQSLLMEMQACRSIEFLQFMTPIAQRTFLGQESNDPAWSVDNLHRLYTKVERSYIRVDADEVTYPLHVIMRYEIERDLVEGGLTVIDIPEVWDTKMQSYFSLSTKGDFKDGCLQDVHWPAGLFGYFPTYTLGAMTAAQFFAAAKAQVPDMLEEIRSGNFVPLLTWLRENIHSKAKFLSFDDLLVNATGETLNDRYFQDHLKQRYL